MPVMTSERTYGAKKSSRSTARPGTAVEHQREAQRERDLERQRQDDDQHVVRDRAEKTGSASAARSSSSPTKSVSGSRPFHLNRL